MKIRFWGAVWRAALALRAWPLLARRCDGYLPCQSWVPTDDSGGGYYRGGIQAQHCQLPRGHRYPLCLAPIDYYGHEVRGGAPFQSQGHTEEPEDWWWCGAEWHEVPFGERAPVPGTQPCPLA